ncbi:hypothetical protein ASG73_04435 [Janibacter sp. Soil728]|uniref:hypothetical protein n=1 Tax=Janibacter sp. Soil728 TaxID=1736393 RepID=UPI0006FC4D32|nr:hypothetical protein [Janibacter sp. Soil728]KRE38216.1 hypothetical protein ASG73_04435 [Janibacter sp. Soil728]
MTEQEQTVEQDQEQEGADQEQEQEPDTFPRDYVEKLRKESAGHRTSAREATEALLPLQERLHGALVGATGRLADPSDLPFDPAHLEDEDALTAAIDALLEAKPHLAPRRVSGDVGQGLGGPQSGVDLGGMLRTRA